MHCQGRSPHASRSVEQLLQPCHRRCSAVARGICCACKTPVSNDEACRLHTAARRGIFDETGYSMNPLLLVGLVGTRPTEILKSRGCTAEPAVCSAAVPCACNPCSPLPAEIEGLCTAAPPPAPHGCACVRPAPLPTTVRVRCPWGTLIGCGMLGVLELRLFSFCCIPSGPLCGIPAVTWTFPNCLRAVASTTLPLPAVLAGHRQGRRQYGYMRTEAASGWCTRSMQVARCVP
jgi:hypothetical protein